MRRSIYTPNPTSPGSSIAVLEPQAMNALSRPFYPAASVELLSSTVESGCYFSEIDDPPQPLATIWGLEPRLLHSSKMLHGIPAMLPPGTE